MAEYVYDPRRGVRHVVVGRSAPSLVFGAHPTVRCGTVGPMLACDAALDAVPECAACLTGQRPDAPSKRPGRRRRDDPALFT